MHSRPDTDTNSGECRRKLIYKPVHYYHQSAVIYPDWDPQKYFQTVDLQIENEFVDMGLVSDSKTRDLIIIRELIH
jgi:hypothetical protein